MSEQDRERNWSLPGADVVEAMGELLDADRRAVVATVVAVEGSAYRRPGAKMLVEEGGAGRGHITAGCLEDEVATLAADVLAAGEPRIETYDLMEDEGDVWGLGVGCNGIIDVLLEPLDERYRPLVEAFEADRPVGVVTALGGDAPLGARAYYRQGAVEAVGATGDAGRDADGGGGGGANADPDPESRDRFPDWLAAAVEEPARRLVEAGTADTLTVETDEGRAELFVDGVRPPPRLVVFGNGHDVGPVVDLAKKNGFRVTVAGFRGAVDLAERFPAADEHVATSPGRAGEELSLSDETYAVVMTHNFVDDRLAVDELLDAAVPYVGLMGPRERFEEMLEAFADEGRSLGGADLERVYTPVGLDLGAGSPYGIATSVVAEAIAVHNDRDPEHLSEREGPIHDRVDLESTTD
jgi:xanthine dehydrogenase accessory factor